MLRSARKILAHRLNAADGEVGRCVDFVIDSSGWRARYLVVERGAKLGGGRVLISPLALDKASWTSRRLVVAAARAQVESAPEFAPGAALSRQDELDVCRHYGWALRGSAALPSEGWPELAPPSPPAPSRSLEELLGYQLQAEDGVVGRVSDFILDDDDWGLPYLVLESSPALGGRSVLVPCDRVLDAAPLERRLLQVGMTSAEVESCPEYDPTAPAYAPAAAAEPLPMASSARQSTPAATWLLGLMPPEAWAPRGLRAALARIIQR